MKDKECKKWWDNEVWQNNQGNLLYTESARSLRWSVRKNELVPKGPLYLAIVLEQVRGLKLSCVWCLCPWFFVFLMIHDIHCSWILNHSMFGWELFQNFSSICLGLYTWHLTLCRVVQSLFTWKPCSCSKTNHAL